MYKYNKYLSLEGIYQVFTTDNEICFLVRDVEKAKALIPETIEGKRVILFKEQPIPAHL